MSVTSPSDSGSTSGSAVNRLRVRWAAIGAAVAVTLGAGTIATVDAVQSSGERLTYVATEPCRLIDTRPGLQFNVGPRTSPLGPRETLTITARGTQGNCTAAQLPDDARALALNITVPFATANGFLTVWGDGTRPDASSLNPAPAQPPAPNGVTTTLSAAGSFNVYNENGSTHLIIDVVGHHLDHNHDDRYYQKSEADARYAPISETSEGAIDSINDQSIPLTGTDNVLLTATVDTRTSGYVMADATVRFEGNDANTRIRCSLSQTTALALDSLMVVDVGADFSTIPMARGFIEDKATIVGDDNEMTVNVVCDAPGSDVTVSEGALTLTFVPDSDAFGGS